MHEEFQVQAQAVDILPKLVRHYGEPFADSSAIPSFYLSELTRRHVTVALNGDGGDESFGGYTRYVSNALAGAARPRAGRRPPRRRRRARRGCRRAATCRARATASAGWPARSRSTRRAATRATWPGSTAAERRALYTPEFAAGGGSYDAIAASWAGTSGASVIDKMLEVDVETYLAGDLIPKIDIATMAYALEARSPFLDHELMQLAASIPATLKVRGAREEVDPARGAPRLAARRPARPTQAGLLGAAVGVAARRPAHVVARDPARPRARSTAATSSRDAVEALLDRHTAGVDDDDQRIWSLLMLELWHREFVDAAAIPERHAA